MKARGIPDEYILSSEISRGLRDYSIIFNFVDPDGNRVEFTEFPPDAKQFRAMQSLKNKE